MNLCINKTDFFSRRMNFLIFATAYILTAVASAPNANSTTPRKGFLQQSKLKNLLNFYQNWNEDMLGRLLPEDLETRILESGLAPLDLFSTSKTDFGHLWNALLNYFFIATDARNVIAQFNASDNDEIIETIKKTNLKQSLFKIEDLLGQMIPLFRKPGDKASNNLWVKMYECLGHYDPNDKRDLYIRSGMQPIAYVDCVAKSRSSLGDANQLAGGPNGLTTVILPTFPVSTQTPPTPDGTDNNNKLQPDINAQQPNKDTKPQPPVDPASANMGLATLAGSTDFVVALSQLEKVHYEKEMTKEVLGYFLKLARFVHVTTDPARTYEKEDFKDDDWKFNVDNVLNGKPSTKAEKIVDQLRKRGKTYDKAQRDAAKPLAVLAKHGIQLKSASTNQSNDSGNQNNNNSSKSSNKNDDSKKNGEDEQEGMSNVMKFVLGIGGLCIIAGVCFLIYFLVKSKD